MAIPWGGIAARAKQHLRGVAVAEIKETFSELVRANINTYIVTIIDLWSVEDFDYTSATQADLTRSAQTIYVCEAVLADLFKAFSTTPATTASPEQKGRRRDVAA